MGSTGPLRDPNAVRRGHVQVLQRDKPRKAPAAKRSWLASTQKHWRSYWRGSVARHLDDAQLPGLERAFDMIDARARMIVEGVSQKELIRSGMERQITIAEKQFGMTAEAKLRLEASAVPEKPSLDELLAEMEYVEPVELRLVKSA